MPALPRLSSPCRSDAERRSGGRHWGAERIFSFGDAHFHGSTGNLVLRAPVVGMAASPDGGGYALFAADGGVFNFDNEGLYGSLGACHLVKPVVGGSADG